MNVELFIETIILNCYRMIKTYSINFLGIWIIVANFKTNNIDCDFIRQSFININESYNEGFQQEIIATSYSGKPFKCKTYSQYLFVKQVKKMI